MTLLRADVPVDAEYSFKGFAQKLLRKSKVQAESGERNANYVKTMQWAIMNNDWGLLDFFGDKDVRQVRTHSLLIFTQN